MDHTGKATCTWRHTCQTPACFSPSLSLSLSLVAGGLGHRHVQHVRLGRRLQPAPRLVADGRGHDHGGNVQRRLQIQPAPELVAGGLGHGHVQHVRLRRRLQPAPRLVALDSWQTGSASTTQTTFYSAEAFNQNVDSWQTGSAKTMGGVFQQARSTLRYTAVFIALVFFIPLHFVITFGWGWNNVEKTFKRMESWDGVPSDGDV